MARQKQKLCPGCNTVFSGKATAVTCSARCRQRLQRARKSALVTPKTEVEKVLVKTEQAVEKGLSALEETAEQALARINPRMISASQAGFIATGAAAQPMGIPSKPAEPINPFNRPQTVSSNQSMEQGDQKIDVKITPVSTVPSTPSPIITPNPQPTVAQNQPQQTEEPLTKPLPVGESLEAPSTTAPSIVVSTSTPSPASNLPPVSIPQGFVDTGAAAQKQQAPPKFKITQSLKDYFKLPLWGKIALAASPFLVGLIIFAGMYLGHRQSQNGNVSLQTSVSSNATSKDLLFGNGTQALHLNVDTSIGGNKTLAAGGPVDFKNQTDSPRAFAVQNAAGNDLLLVNTKDNKITLGSSDQTITLQIAGSVSIEGNITIANANGTTSSLGPSGLTVGSLVVCTVDGCTPNNKDAATLQGQNLAFFTNASNLTSGTVNDNRLSTNVALLNASQIFTGANNLSNSANVFNGSYSGNGSGLTGLNASNVSAGTLTDNRLTSNVALLNRNGQTFTGSQTVQATATTAFQVQNSGGSSTLFVADTTDGKVGIGTASPTDTLNVVGNTSLMQSSVSAPSMTVSGNEMTDATRQAAVQGDGRAYPDSSYGIWPSTTNNEPNGGFESNTTGWQNMGSATISRDATTAKFGSASLKIVTNGAGSGEGATTGTNGTLATSGGLYYSISAWIKGAGTITLALNEYNSAHTFLRQDLSSPMTLTSSWQRLSFAIAVGSTAYDSDVLAITNSTQADTFWVDGVQLEQMQFPTPYVDTNGSTMTRANGEIQGPTANLSPTQSWVALRIRPEISSSLCTANNFEIFFKWALSDQNQVTLFRDCQNNRFAAIRNTNGIATQPFITYNYNAGDTFNVIMAWTGNQVEMSVNGSSFATQNGTSVPNLSSVSMFDLGSAFGLNQYFNGEILWFAAGSGTLTNSDPTTLANLGNTDPNMTTLPSVSQTQMVWQANNAFYLNTTYQPVVLNIRNSLGQSMFGVDASSSSVLMPGLTSAASALILGNDANLYRNASDSLKTDGNLTTGGNLTINGSALFQDLNNSPTAFQVQNAGGTSLLTVDTTNTAITVNASLNVAGTLTISSGSLVTSSSGIYGTSLPASPVNGQEFYYVADATNGVVWHLRYNSTSGYWEYLGGPPLTATGGVLNTNGAWQESAFTTVPLAGDYIVQFTGGNFGSGAANQVCLVGVSIAAGTPSAPTPQTESYTTGSVSPLSSVTKLLTGFTAGQHASSMVNCPATGSPSVNQLSMDTIPVRVH